jgi:hypothetical protein
MGPQELSEFNKTDLEMWINNYNDFINAGGETIMAQIRPSANATNATGNATAGNETADATEGNATANATEGNATANATESNVTGGNVTENATISGN